MLDQTLNTPLHSKANILHKNKNGNITECRKKKSPSTLGSVFSYVQGHQLLHICLVIFISFISFTKVHLFILCKSNSFISSFISISFILQIIVHLIHIHHIWFYSCCIIFQPYCVFHFFNQTRLWKLGVSLDKILIRNIYCIIWS